MLPDDELPRSAQYLESLLEFETLISDLSSRFVNLPAGEVDGGIEDALRRLCESLRFDYAVLWQWSVAAPGVITPTHAYHGQEGLRFTEPLSQQQFPWYREQMLAGSSSPGRRSTPSWATDGCRRSSPTR